MPETRSPQKAARAFLLALIIFLFPSISFQPLLANAASITVGSLADTSPTQTTLTFPLIFNQYHTPSYYPVAYLAEPYFGQQWNMLSIQADIAWDHSISGDTLTPVAVLDTGANLADADLLPNLLPGVDCLTADTNFTCTSPNLPEDLNGHGTHVAGIIAAAPNMKGVLGVAPHAGIIPVRVLDAKGNGTTSSLIAGIQWAAERSRVMNLSLGGPGSDPLLEAAIQNAVDKHGVVMIAAVGNGHLNTSATPFYPASYPNVIGVGAVDRNGQVASFSNYGASVDVVAPGVNICSDYLPGKSDPNQPGIGFCGTVPASGFATLSGTSMAAPHVAGLAALILENHPEYTVAQVTAAIESTALSAASRTDAYGYGLIRADKALGIIAAPASTAVGTDLANPLPTPENQQAAFVPGRVLVKFRSGVQPPSIGVLSTFIAQPTVVGEIGGIGAQVLSVTEGQEWQVVDALRSQPGVEFAQPDYIYTAQ